MARDPRTQAYSAHNPYHCSMMAVWRSGDALQQSALCGAGMPLHARYVLQARPYSMSKLWFSFILC